MTDLGPTERRLLRALQAADEPTDADRARVRARVLAKLGVVSGVVSIAAKSAAVPAAASWKVGAVIVAVIGGVGGAAWIATSPKPSAPLAVAPKSADHGARQPTKAVQASEPARLAPRSDERESSIANDVPARPVPGETRSAKPPAATRPEPGDLDSELALLEEAQQALKQGDSERALAQLERHAVEHPTGVLATERAAVHAVALCESGKVTEGQLEARRFLARNPKSPLAVRVRAACFAVKK